MLEITVFVGENHFTYKKVHDSVFGEHLDLLLSVLEDTGCSFEVSINNEQSKSNE